MLPVCVVDMPCCIKSTRHIYDTNVQHSTCDVHRGFSTRLCYRVGPTQQYGHNHPTAHSDPQLSSMRCTPAVGVAEPNQHTTPTPTPHKHMITAQLSAAPLVSPVEALGPQPHALCITVDARAVLQQHHRQPPPGLGGGGGSTAAVVATASRSRSSNSSTCQLLCSGADAGLQGTTATVTGKQQQPAAPVVVWRRVSGGTPTPFFPALHPPFLVQRPVMLLQMKA